MVCLGMVQKRQKKKAKKGKGTEPQCCFHLSHVLYDRAFHLYPYTSYYYVLLLHCYMDLSSHFVFYRLVILSSLLSSIYGFT